jgi:hypothetical protein
MVAVFNSLLKENHACCPNELEGVLYPDRFK